MLRGAVRLPDDHPRDGPDARRALHLVAQEGLSVRRQRRGSGGNVTGGADPPPLAGHRRRRLLPALRPCRLRNGRRAGRQGGHRVHRHRPARGAPAGAARDDAAIGAFTRALRACLHLDIPFRAEAGRAGTVAGARAGCGVAAQPAGAAQVRAPHAPCSFNPRLKDPFCRQVFEKPGPLRRAGCAHAHRPAPHRLRAPQDDRHPTRRLARLRSRRRAAVPGKTGGRSPLRRQGRATSRSPAARSAPQASPAASSSPRTGCSRPPTGGSRAPSCSARRTVRAWIPDRVSDQPVQVNLGVAEDWSASRRPHVPLAERSCGRRPGATPRDRAEQALRPARRAARQERAHRVPGVRVLLLEAARGGRARLRSGEAPLRRAGHRGC